MAALLTRTSRWSCSSEICAARAFSVAGSVTSSVTGRTSRPAARSGSAAAFPDWSSRLPRYTTWPRSASWRTTSRPMPRLAPVTTLAARMTGSGLGMSFSGEGHDLLVSAGPGRGHGHRVDLPRMVDPVKGPAVMTAEGPGRSSLLVGEQMGSEELCGRDSASSVLVQLDEIVADQVLGGVKTFEGGLPGSGDLGRRDRRGLTAREAGVVEDHLFGEQAGYVVPAALVCVPGHPGRGVDDQVTVAGHDQLSF